MHNNELYHYGRKGMKWGQHIFGKLKEREECIIRNHNEKEKQIVLNYQKAKQYKLTADKGKHLGMTDYVPINKRKGIMTYNIIDDHGNIKMTYYEGKFGHHILAAGKDYVKKNINMNDYFNKNFFRDYDVEALTEYDIYK